MARLSLSHSRSGLTRLSTWLDEQALLLPIPDDVSYAVRLCLEEAVSNLVNHTPAVSDGEDIAVDLVRHDNVLVAVIEDHGPAFDPRAAVLPERPSCMDDTVPGGLGILLLRSFASEIDYHSFPGRNVLTLRFRGPAESIAGHQRTGL